MRTKKCNAIVCAVLVILIIIASLMLKCSRSESEIAYKDYIVSPGQTLWSIAVECSLDQDIRETVWMIREKNNLDSVIIHPGQELLVPIEE